MSATFDMVNAWHSRAARSVDHPEKYFVTLRSICAAAGVPMTDAMVREVSPTGDWLKRDQVAAEVGYWFET